MEEIKWLNKNRIVDLHAHIVPGIDDGARDIDEAIAMIKMEISQGVTDIFCTSHNGYSLQDGNEYREKFSLLQDAVKRENLNVNLYQGCEVLCASDYIDEIVYGLEIGAFPTLNGTRYVLTELYPDCRPSEALTIVRTLVYNGYEPIIAHMERYVNITGPMVQLLVNYGALIQVNAYSLREESSQARKETARDLLKNNQIHFLGSDAHRLTHRPPNLRSGIEYINKTVDNYYTSDILFNNASKYIFGENTASDK